MSTEKFSERKDFIPYSYEHEGVIYQSPFPVMVQGVRLEVLGVETIIGAIEDALSGDPVIAIDDLTAESGIVEILGSKCWWECPIDVDFFASKQVGGRIISASVYIKSLDAWEDF